jgi:hypothetical protein
MKIKITKEVYMDWNRMLFSWETKLVSLAGVVYVAVQGFNEPSLIAAVHDGKLQLAVGLAVLAWLSKSNSAHGTSAEPIPAEQAAQIALVAANTPPSAAFVGDLIAYSADIACWTIGHESRCNVSQDHRKRISTSISQVNSITDADKENNIFYGSSNFHIPESIGKCHAQPGHDAYSNFRQSWPYRKIYTGPDWRGQLLRWIGQHWLCYDSPGHSGGRD